MSEVMIARDLYVRITKPGEKPYVEQHRVWDANLFYASLRTQHAKEGRTVTAITAEIYMKEQSK